MSNTLVQLLQHAAAIKKNGGKVIGCLLLKAKGSTPQSTGAFMLVDEDAELFGTIGGGCVEAEIRRTAHQLLTENRSRISSFKLDHDYGWDDGMLCGGTIEIGMGELPDPDTLNVIANYIESRTTTSLTMEFDSEEGRVKYIFNLPPLPRLYIAGAGHIGRLVAERACAVDFDVTIFDDRSDILKRAVPEGCKGISGDIAEALKKAPIDSNTYCVIVTRGHRHDAKALCSVADRGAAYMGMIGSRRKVKLVFDELIERGISQKSLEKVNAPIGIDIGAMLTDEIAISIVAQLIKVRRSAKVETISGPIAID